MSNVILKLKNTPKDHDVLIFDKDGFKCINKDMFLIEVDAKTFANHEDIKLLKREIEELKAQIRFLKGEE